MREPALIEVNPRRKARLRNASLSRVESESSVSGERSRNAHAAWTRSRSPNGVTGISSPSWGRSRGNEIDVRVRQWTVSTWRRWSPVNQASARQSQRPKRAPSPIFLIPARPTRSGVSRRQAMSALGPLRWCLAYAAAS